MHVSPSSKSCSYAVTHPMSDRCTIRSSLMTIAILI
jgi:hypothetical protein